MIPALSLMVGAYIVARMLDSATREGVQPGVYWASILTCVVAMGCVAYIFLLAREVGVATEGLQDSLRNLGY